MLVAKILLRRTWEDECERLGWDDPLPELLVKDIIAFFVELFELEKISFPRSLWPRDAEVEGQPDRFWISCLYTVEVKHRKMVVNAHVFQEQNSSKK